MNILFLILPLLRLSLATGISDFNEEQSEKIIYNLEEADVLFTKFIEEYDKEYDENEAKYRLEVFKDNLRRFNEWNKMYIGAVYGITSLADLTRDEFMSFGSKVESSATYEDIADDVPSNFGDVSPKFSNKVPSKVSNEYMEVYTNFPQDWRKKGVVTDVKDQGRCACSYIFSAIGAIEGQYAMKYKKLVSFSEQQALDCNEQCVCNSTNISPKNILQSLKVHGMATESHYPYTQKKGTCKFQRGDAVAFVRLVNEMSLQNELAIELALGANGPAAVTMLLSETLQGYKSGIMDPLDCHGIPWYIKLPVHYFLLVASGADENVPYWVLKNSWGQKWGERGYLRVLKGKNICKIANSIVFATVK